MPRLETLPPVERLVMLELVEAASGCRPPHLRLHMEHQDSAVIIETALSNLTRAGHIIIDTRKDRRRFYVCAKGTLTGWQYTPAPAGPYHMRNPATWPNKP